MNKIYICFPEGKFKVLTFSYDDGKEEDRKLVEIFNKHGLKGTFNVNGGLTENNRIPMTEYKKLYNGHEVAGHTLTHPTIARCPISEVATEIMEDRKILEQTMGTYVRGLAYPNGSYSEEIEKLLPMLGIEYGRTVNSTKKFDLPTNYTSWNPTCHHNEDLIELGEKFVELNKSQYLYMMYVWGHSYEFPRDNNWHVIEEFCEMVSGRDDIWYATNIEIYDYLTSAKQLKYSMALDRVFNPFSFSVWLSVNGEIVEVKAGEDKYLG